MSLQEALAGVKLKHAAKPTSTAAFEKQLCETSEQYLQLLREAYFEEWFDKLTDVTFKSSMAVEISVEAAAAIGASHTQWQATGRCEWKHEPSLVALAKSIDEQMNLLGCSTYFVRMSTRSPKDAALTCNGVSDIVKQAMTELTEYENSSGRHTSSLNRAIHALYIASVKVLAIKSGEEAVDLFVRSDRVQDDLQRAVESNKSDLHVIVREFALFEPEFELRAFIYNGKLTALTQYNEFVVFPRLISMKQDVSDLVRNFVETDIVPRLGELHNFILDIVLISKTPHIDRFRNLTPVIVELNPIGEFAGTGLFNWLTDKQVILGQKPYEFRVRETIPTNDLVRDLSPQWANLLNAPNLHEDIQPKSPRSAEYL